MPIITKLSSQKSQKRVNLYLDGQFFCGLDLAIVLKNNLKVGQALSQKEMSTLINQSISEELFQKAANFISYRPRSEKEIKDYLFHIIKKRKTKLKPIFPSCHQIDAEHSSSSKYQNDALCSALINQIIERLKSNGLINDHKFVNWWLNQRLQFRPKGKIALKAELLKKGVSREIIDKALKDISSENEIIAAKRVLEKALKVLQSVDPKKRKQRLISRLLSKGFSWEIVKTLIDEIGV